MVEFMNMFFLPSFTLYIYYRRNGWTVDDKIRLFMQYCMVTVCNFLCGKVFLRVLAVLFINIEVSTASYTPIGLVIACILPYIYEIFRKCISIRCEIRKNEMQEKKKP